MANRAGPTDWLSAEPTDDNGNVAYRLNVNIVGGAASYTGPLAAQFPAALGAGGGLKVDGSGTALPVSGTVTARPPAITTATRSDVVAAAADTALLAVNTNRLPGTTIANDSTAILYVLLGATGASATNFTVAIDGKTTVPGLYTLPDGYTGAVRGFWVSATGSARITELSA